MNYFRRPFVVRSGQLGLALGVGLLGVGGFLWLNLPLPWMLGALTTTTLAAMVGVPVAVPSRLRQAMLAVLGVLLGCAFTPPILQRVDAWGGSLSALMLFVVVCTVLGALMLRRWGGFDRVTAFFTATPGGLNEMVAVGKALGGDEQTIALAHSLRILVVVLVVPLGFQLYGGYQPGARGPLGPDFLALSLWDAGLLLSSLLAIVPAVRLRLPAATLLGPMILCAALHLTGATLARPPGEVVALAQLVIGAAIGSRFAGVSWPRFRRCALAALALAVLMLGLAVTAATLLSGPTGIAIPALVLAFAPGGLAEMSLVALALGIDVAFVSTHHVVRVLLIVIAVPLAYALGRALMSGRFGNRSGGTSAPQ